jgi:hypothetical protein
VKTVTSSDVGKNGFTIFANTLILPFWEDTDRLWNTEK